MTRPLPLLLATAFLAGVLVTLVAEIVARYALGLWFVRWVGLL